MSNSFAQFKSEMAWTMLELTENQLEEIYLSINADSYKDTDELEADYDMDDYLLFWDVNLHSVIENFSSIIERGLFHYVTIYYLADDDMYAGVLTYS